MKSLYRCKVVILGAICFFMMLPAMAQPEPAVGRFLVATENIDKGIFKESVVLLIRHEEKGSMGVIINKPSEMAMARVVPEHNLPKSDANFYFGGPVKPMMVSSLSYTKRGHPSMTPILQDTYWTPGLPALAHIIEQLRGEERTRAYMGVSSWRAGQLSEEIMNGDWLVVTAESEQVLSKSPEGLWSRLYNKWSGDWI